MFTYFRELSKLILPLSICVALWDFITCVCFSKIWKMILID